MTLKRMTSDQAVVKSVVTDLVIPSGTDWTAGTQPRHPLADSIAIPTGASVYIAIWLRADSPLPDDLSLQFDSDLSGSGFSLGVTVPRGAVHGGTVNNASYADMLDGGAAEPIALYPTIATFAPTTGDVTLHLRYAAEVV